MLEWFGFINVQVTSTEWNNFFDLRLELDHDGHPVPQDEMYDLASQIYTVRWTAADQPIEIAVFWNHDDARRFAAQTNDEVECVVTDIIPSRNPRCTDPIIVRYRSLDRYSERRVFKTLAGARRYAHKWIGAHPDLGRFYAVSEDGIGKIEVEGATLADIFPEEPTPPQPRYRSGFFGPEKLTADDTDTGDAYPGDDCIEPRGF